MSAGLKEGPDAWLIRKGGYFYRTKRCGYTTVKAEAGRYTEAEAKREASVEPWHMAAILADDVPDPQHVLDKRDAEIARLSAEVERLRGERDANHNLAIANGSRAKEEEARAEAAEAEVERLKLGVRQLKEFISRREDDILLVSRRAEAAEARVAALEGAIPAIIAQMEATGGWNAIRWKCREIARAALSHTKEA